MNGRSDSIDSDEGRIHSLAASLYYVHQLNRGAEDKGPIFESLPSVHQVFFESLIRLALQAAEHWEVPARESRPEPFDYFKVAAEGARTLGRFDEPIRGNVVGVIGPKEIA